MSTLFFRYRPVTPTEDMVDIDGPILRDIMRRIGVNQSELSVAIGYNKLYISTCTCDGRMPKELVEALASLLGFEYKEVVKPKKKKRK